MIHCIHPTNLYRGNNKTSAKYTSGSDIIEMPRLIVATKCEYEHTLYLRLYLLLK